MLLAATDLRPPPLDDPLTLRIRPSSQATDGPDDQIDQSLAAYDLWQKTSPSRHGGRYGTVEMVPVEEKP
jgi:hypothetical protein